MNDHPRVALCIINYNGESYLDDTLRAAVDREDLFEEIVLVDNGSSDGSLSLVRESYPSVRIVTTGRNGGPSFARNHGWREMDSERILFIDNDVVLDGRCVEILLEALDERPGAVAAMPSVLYASYPDLVQYDGASCHYVGTMEVHHQKIRRAEQDRTVRSIGSIITACCLVDRTRWRGGDPFDENFFVYLEDHDFGMRIRMGGGDIISVPEAACLHKEGAAGLSLRKTGRYSPIRVTNLILNRWQIIGKNYSLKSILLFSPVFIVYELSLFATAIAKGWIPCWWEALTWMVRNSFALIRRRRAVQAARLVPDREILHGGPNPFTVQLTAGRAERAARKFLDIIVENYWKLIRRAL